MYKPDPPADDSGANGSLFLAEIGTAVPKDTNGILLHEYCTSLTLKRKYKTF